MARQLEDFLTGYLEYCKGTEPPINYHLWCAISAIAAALQRKAYINWGVETILPNMYIVLIGPSGNRKGVAMGILQDIIREVGIRSTAESITREALIRDLRDSVNKFDDPDGGIKFHCSLTAFSEELSIFLGQNDVKFLADLTDWYNCKPEWTYRTKGQGTDKIQGICFNLLGATAPDWLVSILPREAIGGGFTARIIFVVEEQKAEIVPLPKEPDLKLRTALIKDLEQIHLVCGEYRFTPEAISLYKGWYEQSANGSYGIKDPKFAAYNERRATHIKKLGMIMSASRGSDRKITLKDLERAVGILEKTEIKMPRVFRSLGKSRYSEVTMQVFDYIVLKKQVSASEILNKFYLDVDDYTLDVVSKTLQAMKVIDVKWSEDKRDKIFILLKKEI